jgi:S-DNA-T family DNA segregation ATPase FtsK/SpoIIIE
MLFAPGDFPKPVRIQGAFVSEQEVARVVDFIKGQFDNPPSYDENITSQITFAENDIMNGGATNTLDNERDELFVQAAKFIIEKDKASIGMLQRVFRIGFNRAARIMDQLYEAGVVGAEEGTKPRVILMSEEQFESFLKEE